MAAIGIETREQRDRLPQPLRKALTQFQRVPYGNEIAVLLVLVLAMPFFRGGFAASVGVSGVVSAAPLILNALGLVLVFRANRFLNLAQVQIGLFAGSIFTGLYQGQVLLHTLHRVCNSCVGPFPGHTAQAINFWISVAVGLLVSGLVSVLVYVVVIRRFAQAPVLVSTIVTVFLAQALNGIQKYLTGKLVHSDDLLTGRALQNVNAPISATWTISGYPVSLPNMILVVLAPILLVATVVYLRKSETGVAIRAAADNPGRAATLGVDVTSVTSRIWLIIGLFSGLAAIIPGFIGGVGAASAQDQSTPTIPVSQLVVLLTVLAFARFVNLWLAAAAAVVLSTLATAVQVSYSSSAPLDASYVLIVGVLLLLQRQNTSRANREDFSGLEVTRELRPIPHELRNLPVVRKYVRSGILISSALVLGLPFAISLSQTSLLIDSLGLAIIGLSLLVLTGWGGQVSLGQFGFASIGAWAAALGASHGLPFPLAILLGGIAGGGAAILVGLPALKLQGLNLAISTIAFAVSAQALFIDDNYLGSFLPDSITAPKFLGIDFSDERVVYYMTLAILLAFVGVVIGLRRSRTGRVLIAIRSNEATAQSFGINVLRARLVSFSVSGFMAAVAGALLAYHLGRVAPQAFTPDKSLTVFLYAVLGGLGGLAGPLLGMGFYALITFFFADNPLVQYFGAGVGAILLMLLAPGGLGQLVYGVRDAMLRRLAFRLRIPVPSLMGDKGASLTAERVVLDEKREAPRRPGEPLPLDYKPAGQWALERLGRADGNKERVGSR